MTLPTRDCMLEQVRFINLFPVKRLHVGASLNPDNILTGDHMVRHRKQERRNGAQSSQDIKSMGRTLPDGTQGESSIMVLPFILHLVFMTFTAFFVMHVQVATRFLSASPPIYWFASYVLASPSSYKKWGYLIWVYFVAYVLLGSLLFSNFYPFT